MDGAETTPRSHFISGGNMLSWSLTFFIVAILAGILGFTGISAAAASVAKVLFFIFLIAFVISLIMGRRKPRV